MKLLFLSIEINLLCWLAVGGLLVASPSQIGLAQRVAIVGCAFAAVIQHWAYYSIRRKGSSNRS